jgi:acetylornithine deacetylase/succinyl-diaminopimelate desuccinylase-like protein
MKGMNPLAAPLDLLADFIRFPSISAQPSHAHDIRACAEWVRTLMDQIGLTAHLHETPGCPVVVGRNLHEAGRPTVLFYGHYDVQPVDPVALWKTSPFEAVVRDGMVYGRGSSDNKGQILAHLLGLAEGLRKGKLPVNVVVLVEGEEEVGSPHLAEFLSTHKEELACDIVVISDNPMVAPGIPTFTYAMRGVAALELTLRGPSHDLHSGMFGGIVANPLTELARLLGSLHDANRHIAVPGFYEGVPEPEPWERAAWSELPLAESDLLRMTGSPQLQGEAGYSTLERLWCRPTLEVNGLWGGYQGAGSKTVIPSEAHAKITCRIVPGQDAHRLLDLLRDYLVAQCPPSVRIEVELGHVGRPARMEVESPMAQAALRALRMSFGDKKPALIRDGATIPVVADFQKILGTDTLLLGLCYPDCGAHAPNESFPVANLDLGIKLNQALLREIAAEYKG